MNDYSEIMKSEDASVVLRKFTQSAALGQTAQYHPLERFYDDFALLICQPKNGWAVGLRIDFTSESWSVAELVAIPSGPAMALPSVSDDDMQSYIENAVSRARGRREAAAEHLAKLAVNADFIQARFDTWRDKKATRSNVEYAALAAKYAEQIRIGNSRATATLAELVGMAPSVMAQRIKEARRRLLLSAGERGRASGTLTPLGVLYLDPEFPGLRQHRLDGMTQRGIADRYGIEERYVWAALMADGYSDAGAFLSPGDFMPVERKE